MKNVLIIFSVLFLLTACKGDTETTETNTGTSETTEQETETDTSMTEDSGNTTDDTDTSATDTIETTGEFAYYPAEGPTGFEETASEKICFTPAQMDTTNEGNMFCFTNQDEALSQLDIPTDETCTTNYWGVATVEIEGLTNDTATTLKSDPCFAAGTCKFNEAELIAVKEIDSEAECYQ